MVVAEVIPAAEAVSVHVPGLESPYQNVPVAELAGIVIDAPKAPPDVPANAFVVPVEFVAKLTVVAVETVTLLF